MVRILLFFFSFGYNNIGSGVTVQVILLSIVFGSSSNLQKILIVFGYIPKGEKY